METNKTQLKAALLRNDGDSAHLFLTSLTPLPGVNGLGGGMEYCGQEFKPLSANIAECAARIFWRTY